MKRMKYIITDTDLMETVYIFSVWATHADVAQRLGQPVVSAGFVEFRKGTVEASGDSVSLNIASRPEDSKLIALQLGLAMPPGETRDPPPMRTQWKI